MQTLPKQESYKHPGRVCAFFFFFNLFCLPHLTWEGLGADGFSDVSLCGQKKEEVSIAGTIPGRQAASVGAEVSGRAC